MRPADIEERFGQASEIEEGQVPEGSVVGLQEAFAYKLPSGAPYLLWRYLRGNRTFIVVFAHAGDVSEWRLSFRVGYPSAIDGR